MGQVRFWGERTILIGPFEGYPCPECTATGVRDPPGVCVPAPCPDAEYRWRIGDVVQIMGLAPNFTSETAMHPEEAVQKIYLAEGHNHVVRVANIASPSNYECSSVFPKTWEYREGIPT
mmetsp:Transcript_1462/g.4004  ORF Transcript_1462/g.4004 Transcript_1462/m.4004 type:complete len:119 (-) Transcript_1462:71-427(-)